MAITANLKLRKRLISLISDMLVDRMTSMGNNKVTMAYFVKRPPAIWTLANSFLKMYYIWRDRWVARRSNNQFLRGTNSVK